MIGNSLLRGTEPAICTADNQTRVVICLPGAAIKGVIEELTKIIKSIDYYSFLLFHMGTNDMIKSLETISRDYEHLGMKAKQMAARVVFSSVLQMKDRQ